MGAKTEIKKVFVGAAVIAVICGLLWILLYLVVKYAEAFALLMAVMMFLFMSWLTGEFVYGVKMDGS